MDRPFLGFFAASCELRKLWHICLELATENIEVPSEAHAGVLHTTNLHLRHVQPFLFAEVKALDFSRFLLV